MNPVGHLSHKTKRGTAMKRKLLSILLCLCLICGLLSGGALAAHHCVDSDNDGWCDDCCEFLPHECVDEDGDYCCNTCGGPAGHDCVDKDADNLCDVCSRYHDHCCVDQDCNYLCDHCGMGIRHLCTDADSDDWCNLCGQSLSNFTVPVKVTVNSGLQEDIYAELNMEAPFDFAAAAFHGNISSESLELAPGVYTWSIRKYGHRTRTGTVTVGTEQVDLNLTVCPIGDASGDGALNIGDTAKIYSHIRGSARLTDDYALDCADVSGDGRLNLGDIARVYAHIRGTELLW